MTEWIKTTTGEVSIFPLRAYRANALIVAGAVFLTILFLTLRDFHRIPVDLRSWFLGGKFLLGALAALGFWLAYAGRITFALFAFLWALHVAHCSQGQFFGARYYVGYIEGALAAFFLIPGTPRQMVALMAGGFLIYTTTVFVSPTTFQEVNPGWFIGDVIFSSVVANVIGFIGYFFVLKDRRQKEELYRRFADTGKYSAMVLHDIKNMILAPGMAASLLRRRFRDKLAPMAPGTPGAGIDPTVLKLIETIDVDLERARKFMHEMEQMAVGPGIEECETVFSIHELVSSLKVLIGSRLGSVRIDLHGDLVLAAPKRYLMRALINILMNAIDALKKKGITPGLIEIRTQGNRVIISDNGGGFAPEVLERIEAAVPVTNKENGSGLGVMIIRDYMEALGGRAHFANGSTGAVVTLEVPESCVKNRV